MVCRRSRLVRWRGGGRNRPKPGVVIVLVLLTIAVSTWQNYEARLHVPTGPIANVSLSRPKTWWFAKDLELWIANRHRRHLETILQQVEKTKRSANTIKRLEQSCENGFVKENSSFQDHRSGHVSVPPPEFDKLVKLEERIGKLRYQRRIAYARKVFLSEERSLKNLRRPWLHRVVARIPRLLVGGFLAQRFVAFISDKRVRKRIEEIDTNKAMETIAFLMQLYSLRTPTVKPEVVLPNDSLEDVVGIDVAKREATEIVDCLTAPVRYKALGARCPKGLLLKGPPGCGKTMLARAIASSAAVPFISRSGSDFNRMFAGQAAAMVKDLFRRARTLAPVVVFIDEIDFIGRRRDEERGGGAETDRSSALTELLAQMDGFHITEGILVIGVTNFPDILDKALLRPGRFDRLVDVPLPDIRGRSQILAKHAQRFFFEMTGFQLANFTEQNWTLWARRTPGFTGADLEGLLNEAAMVSIREGTGGIAEKHLQVAYDKVLMGLPSGQRPSYEEMKLRAAHEAGHAVVNEVMRETLKRSIGKGYRTVAYISIVPTQGVGGVTQFAQPDDESRLPETRKVLLARIVVLLGGRAGEEVIHGTRDVTAGARDDLQQATSIASTMVTEVGLSEVIGPRAFLTREKKSISERTLQNIDSEVDNLLRIAMKAARAALAQNQKLHEVVMNTLIENETMDGDTFYELIRSHEASSVFIFRHSRRAHCMC